MKLNELRPIVIRWIDEVVMPASSTGQKFIITFALMQSADHLDELLQYYGSFIADKNGDIDVDKAYSNAKAALDKASPTGEIELNLTFFRWKFDRADLDKLYDIYKAQTTRPR